MKVFRADVAVAILAFAVTSAGCDKGRTARVAEPEVSQSTQSWDGPFGVKMGLDRSQLRKVIGDPYFESDNALLSRKAPTEIRPFKKYMYAFTSDGKLCAVQGTFEVEAGQDGAEVKEAYADLVDKLKRKYGNPTNEVDETPKNAMLAEEQFWMMSLSSKDRSLKTEWANFEPKAQINNKIPAELDYLSVTAEGTDSPRTAEISLIYLFANSAKCKSDMDAQSAKNL